MEINKHGLHLSRKGAAVFAEGLSGVVASGSGKVSYMYYTSRKLYHGSI